MLNYIIDGIEEIPISSKCSPISNVGLHAVRVIILLIISRSSDKLIIKKCIDSEKQGEKYCFPELPPSESISKFCTTFSTAAISCALRFENGSTFGVCKGRESTDEVDGDAGREFEGINN